MPPKPRRPGSGPLKNESGTIFKSWADRISVALAFPNTYYVGMSNLGFHAVYRRFNQHDDVVCERLFLPDPQPSGAGRPAPGGRRRGRGIRSLESGRLLREFELIAFSLTYENDFINILEILEQGHIPVRSSDRSDRHPLVLAGGVCAFLNPEPVADFIDGFFIGEGESLIDDFLAAYRRARPDSPGRGEMLRTLALEISGFYAPRFYRFEYAPDGAVSSALPSPGLPARIPRRWEKDLDRSGATSAVLTGETEFGDMSLVELSRGCPRGCRFCAAAFAYRPARFRSPTGAVDAVTAAIRGLGDLPASGKVGLIGAAIADFPNLEAVAAAAGEAGGTISPPSLRADRLSDDLVKHLAAGRHRTLTLAPEAGTERLRRVVNKKLDDAALEEAIRLIAGSGISKVKLYFMLGLPTETGEDVDGIAATVKRINHLALSLRRGAQKPLRISLSLSPFVPKGATPFQWHPMERVGALGRKIRRVRDELKRTANVSIIHGLPKWAYIQGLLARGDRRVGRLLEAAWRNGGDWQRAFVQVDLNPDFYVHRSRPAEEVFPWDLIDHGVPKSRLREEYRRALHESGRTAGRVE